MQHFLITKASVQNQKYHDKDTVIYVLIFSGCKHMLTHCSFSYLFNTLKILYTFFWRQLELRTCNPTCSSRLVPGHMEFDYTYSRARNAWKAIVSMRCQYNSLLNHELQLNTVAVLELSYDKCLFVDMTKVCLLTMFVAFVSDTKPSLSSIMASSAWARLPSICIRDE